MIKDNHIDLIIDRMKISFRNYIRYNEGGGFSNVGSISMEPKYILQPDIKKLYDTADLLFKRGSDGNWSLQREKPGLLTPEQRIRLWEAKESINAANSLRRVLISEKNLQSVFDLLKPDYGAVRFNSQEDYHIKTGFVYESSDIQTLFPNFKKLYDTADLLIVKRDTVWVIERDNIAWVKDQRQRLLTAMGQGSAPEQKGFQPWWVEEDRQAAIKAAEQKVIIQTAKLMIRGLIQFHEDKF